MSKSNKDLIREIADEVDTFDIMLSSLVELLEEKGVITQKEWEHRIKRKSLRARGIKSYRDIQFSE
jgi:hypothetical protein